MVYAFLTSYLQGVYDLKEKVEKRGRDHEILSILQIRLKENIGEAQLYGETPDNRADRMMIFHELNKITEHLFGNSFLDFCQSDKHQDNQRATSVAYKGVPAQKKLSVEATSQLDKINRSEALKEALISAFPTPGSLQQLATFCLGKNLAVIAQGGRYDTIVSNLIIWAEAHGETEKLIAGARQMSPGNPRLRKFAE